jgi:hypothetical protein
MLYLFDVLRDALAWLLAAGIVPLAGTLAAVVAALSVDTRLWIKSPRKFLWRSLRVAVIWLAVAWLVSGLVILAGGGKGAGGSSGSGDEAADDVDQVELPETRSEVSTQTPPGFPAADRSVVVLIQFLPLPGDAAQARDLSCDLVFREAGGPRRSEIRAADMEEFEDEVLKQLRDYALPADVEAPVVSIERYPFPGEGTLRRLTQLVRISHPEASVRIEDRAAP